MVFIIRELQIKEWDVNTPIRMFKVKKEDNINS